MEITEDMIEWLDYIVCPICNKPYVKIYKHLKNFNDLEHKTFFNEQLEKIKNLFYDYTFTKDSNLKDYGIYIHYYKCCKLWLEMYGKEECKKRANKLNGNSVSKALKDRPLADAHKEALAIAHQGQIPWNKGLTAETNDIVRQYTNNMAKTMAQKRIYGNIGYSICGYRKDIGHYAASTYEANIYRIFQYEQKRYNYEFDCIFPLQFDHGKIQYYRIDIQDIDGLFGVPNAYIEVKSYMYAHSLLKIQEFRKQYPNETLLIIGKNNNKKYNTNWTVDFDIDALQKKYKPLIPLWETPKQNLRKTPDLYI